MCRLQSQSSCLQTDDQVTTGKHAQARTLSLQHPRAQERARPAHKKGKTAMNKDQLASVVASEVGLSQSDAKAAVDAVFDGITNGMKNGDKVSIAGFGQFESRYRAARQGRNPATGETIQIAAKNAPAFKAAKGLKDALN